MHTINEHPRIGYVQQVILFVILSHKYYVELSAYISGRKKMGTGGIYEQLGVRGIGRIRRMGRMGRMLSLFFIWKTFVFFL